MSDSDKKYKILIVDDAQPNIAVLIQILKADYKLVPVINGEKALKFAQGGNPPDLILLDVMMPGMDGYEVCRIIKSDENTKDIPIIFVTGNVTDEEREKGMALGAADYLTKPVDAAAVLEKISEILSG